MMTLRVKDLMNTPPILIESHCSLADAAATMESSRVRHLPVVDERDRTIGIVSRSDLLVALDLERAARGTRAGLRVVDIMRHPVHTIGLDTPVHKAAEILLAEKIGSLPVIDADERIAGMLTAADFVELARRLLVGLSPIPPRVDLEQPAE